MYCVLGKPQKSSFFSGPITKTGGGAVGWGLGPDNQGKKNFKKISIYFSPKVPMNTRPRGGGHYKKNVFGGFP